MLNVTELISTIKAEIALAANKRPHTFLLAPSAGHPQHCKTHY